MKIIQFKVMDSSSGKESSGEIEDSPEGRAYGLSHPFQILNGMTRAEIQDQCRTFQWKAVITGEREKPEDLPDAKFNGPEYMAEPEVHHVRLRGQILRIFNLMKDGKWRTLEEIEFATRDPQASISAQLRHLRKKRFGGHTVEREHLGHGLYRYKVTPSAIIQGASHPDAPRYTG